MGAMPRSLAHLRNDVSVKLFMFALSVYGLPIRYSSQRTSSSKPPWVPQVRQSSPNPPQTLATGLP